MRERERFRRSHAKARHWTIAASNESFPTFPQLLLTRRFAERGAGNASALNGEATAAVDTNRPLPDEFRDRIHQPGRGSVPNNGTASIINSRAGLPRATTHLSIRRLAQRPRRQIGPSPPEPARQNSPEGRCDYSLSGHAEPKPMSPLVPNNKRPVTYTNLPKRRADPLHGARIHTE